MLIRFASFEVARTPLLVLFSVKKTGKIPTRSASEANSPELHISPQVVSSLALRVGVGVICVTSKLAIWVGGDQTLGRELWLTRTGLCIL